MYEICMRLCMIPKCDSKWWKMQPTMNTRIVKIISFPFSPNKEKWKWKKKIRWKLASYLLFWRGYYCKNQPDVSNYLILTVSYFIFPWGGHWLHESEKKNLCKFCRCFSGTLSTGNWLNCIASIRCSKRETIEVKVQFSMRIEVADKLQK